MSVVIKETLILDKGFSETNYKRLQNTLVYIENNLIDSHGGMCLTIDSLIQINNIIAGSNNINLKKVNVKPYGFDRMCMDKNQIEDKLYQITDQFNEVKITSVKFYSILLSEIRPFYDENGRTRKILLTIEDKNKVISETKNQEF